MATRDATFHAACLSSTILHTLQCVLPTAVPPLNLRPGRGVRFCPPLMFFVDVTQTNHLIFASFSVPDHKRTEHLLKKEEVKIGL